MSINCIDFFFHDRKKSIKFLLTMAEKLFIDCVFKAVVNKTAFIDVFVPRGVSVAEYADFTCGRVAFQEDAD